MKRKKNIQNQKTLQGRLLFISPKDTKGNATPHPQCQQQQLVCLFETNIQGSLIKVTYPSEARPTELAESCLESAKSQGQDLRDIQYQLVKKKRGKCVENVQRKTEGCTCTVHRDCAEYIPNKSNDRVLIPPVLRCRLPLSNRRDKRMRSSLGRYGDRYLGKVRT